MDDKAIAKKIAMAEGNVQDFYKMSETSKTKFYLENGGAYCALLEILIAYGY